MIINGKMSFVKSDISENKWLVRCLNGNNLLVSKETKNLLILLQDSNSFEEAHQKFCSEFNTAITIENFIEFVDSKLMGLGILAKDKSMQTKESYLSVKHKIINENLASAFSRPLQILFGETVFWIIFIPTLVLHIYIIYILQANKFKFTEINYIELGFIFFISTCLHELGHIAACAKNKIKHGHIGWGVYFLFPVFYSDISNVWAANKKTRIMANLGGVFSEMLFAFLIYAGYKFSDNQTLLLCYYSILVRIFWQFYPFVRSDGYWILSDLIDIPNLLPKANRAVGLMFQLGAKNFFLKKITAYQESTTQKQIFILIYGFVNIGVTVTFIITILRRYIDQILNFPKILFFIFLDILHLKIHLNELKSEYLLIAVWYYVIIRILIRIYKKILSKRKVLAR